MSSLEDVDSFTWVAASDGVKQASGMPRIRQRQGGGRGRGGGPGEGEEEKEGPGFFPLEFDGYGSLLEALS